jgi:uncharacterized protein HemX
MTSSKKHSMQLTGNALADPLASPSVDPVAAPPSVRDSVGGDPPIVSAQAVSRGRSHSFWITGGFTAAALALGALLVAMYFQSEARQKRFTRKMEQEKKWSAEVNALQRKQQQLMAKNDMKTAVIEQLLRAQKRRKERTAAQQQGGKRIDEDGSQTDRAGRTATPAKRWGRKKHGGKRNKPGKTQRGPKIRSLCDPNDPLCGA